MATLLIGAAVNIGVGLLLNTLFPPPDIQQEGPRLADLGFTSASYGKFVNILFGTDRIDGNVIDTTDPAIEEVVNIESSSAGGKGGGQQISNKTYTYFFTGRVSFCIEGADALIRLWGDGKLIYDVSGTGQIVRGNGDILFYPGGEIQIQDPEEVSRRGSDIPAYRHLTTIKINRMLLADFGNRIPNFTAEITFNSETTVPVLNLVEVAGMQVPATPAGEAYMSVNLDRNEVYSLRNSATGMWSATASDLVFKTMLAGAGFSHPTVGRDNFAYSQSGGGNSSPLKKMDLDSGAVVGTFGEVTLSTTDASDRFGNSGTWYQLNFSQPGLGVKSVVFHMNTFGDSNGSVVDPDLIPLPPGVSTAVVHNFSVADGFPSQQFAGFGLPDHDRNRFFIFIQNTANSSYDLFKVTPIFAIGTGGFALNDVEIELVRQFTRGTAPDDFVTGTGSPQGWAINRTTGDLILSNGSSAILYNPDTDTLLAKSGSINFVGRNNYYSGNIIAYGITNITNGTIRVFDTRTLAIVKDIKTDDIPWPSGADGEISEPSCVWDDRVDALFLSRATASSGAATDFRILKVFVNRVSSLGIGLDEVVSALSTSYQRQTMAGLEPADIDVTELASDTVLGYTINRKSTMRSALEPLRQRYFFDGVQSDWIVKFPKRGQTSVLTIPEEHVGQLKRGRDQTDEPAIRELRQDDMSLPMSLAIRYRNKDSDYQVDYEIDKRHLFPDPTMRSKSELTLNLPLVDVSTDIKQTAQKQLFTMWNERVSYKTVIPWTYLKLDATDVFELGVFGETVQLRMAENDLGAGWAVELTGVVEDTKSFSSTLGGGLSLGHISPNVPSSLPTQIVPLDAPILDVQDFLLTPVSNAYIASAGYESSWPGATLFKSVDDSAFVPTGTTQTEAVLASVRTAPGVWASIEGDFPNRIQEVVDGGSMVVASIRGVSFWASTTEFNMLTLGSNAIAVIGTDGEVEIINYIDVIDNGDNTFTLQRLLRGRLGTEDVADGGVNVGDKVVGLKDSNGFKQDASINKQDIPLSQLNTSLFFRGVTTGTLLEDADSVSFTYTGRDIKPFSVAHMNAVASGEAVHVSWDRRTRGPFGGEWLDGTGSVPLNEIIEQFEASITDGINTITRVVDDEYTLTFSPNELSTANIDINTPGSIVTVQQVSGASDLIKSPAIDKTLAAPLVAAINPTFSNVILLTGFDLSDGNQTAFVEESSVGRTISFVNQGQPDTDVKKFGRASYLGDGVADACSVPQHADFDLGTDLFTIECWAKWIAGTDKGIFGRSSGGADRYTLFMDANGNMEFYATASGLTLQGTSDFRTGSWMHLAVVRDAGNVFRLYVNGIREHQVTVARNIGASVDPFFIGTDPASFSARSWNGWIDEFRFTRGEALYSAATIVPPIGAFARS